MSMHGDGEKPPSKFVWVSSDKSMLGHVKPSSKLKGDERVLVYAHVTKDMSTIRQVLVHRAELRVVRTGLADKAWNDEADARDQFIAKPAPPKTIERPPAFGFREFVCRWVTSKFKDQVLDPLIADCDADFVEAVHKGDVPAQKRIKFKTHLWICHALFRGMISGVFGLFGRHRNSVE